jgi:hypothetical protein
VTNSSTAEAPAPAGHNQPPSPFEVIRDEINSLYEDAKGWLDGEPVTNQGQADGLNKLIGMIREAEKEADALRKEEARPFDDGKAEVQARYNPLIAKGKGKTALAMTAAKQALTPWLDKLDREQREAEAKARAEAEEAARKAAEAFQSSSVDDLAAREEAERLAEEAKQKDIAARQAANVKAQAKGGAGRATGLRSFYRAEVTDATEFARYCWQNHRAEMSEFLQGMAKRLVDTNHDQKIPGVTIHEDRRAV